MLLPTANDTTRDFLSPAEVAQRIGVSRSHVYKLIQAGELPSRKLGRTIKIPVRLYEHWLAKQDGQP